MSAGEFVGSYSNGRIFDALLTCFFIDTANNFYSYLRCIANMLPMPKYNTNENGL